VSASGRGTLGAWVLCAALSAACHAARAQQAEPGWPHLRGPNYDGVSAETGLADSWPPEGPPVLWRAELGQGYSGIIAVGDRLYTQDQSRSGQYVVCLDAETGRRVWRHRYDWPFKPESDWPGPRATPTYHRERIYFAGAFGLVGCVTARDGRPVWSVNLTEKFEGEGTEFGYSCSPLVENGKVFFPVGGKGAAVVALHAADGSVAWRSGDWAASYCSALPVTVNGRRQIVTFLRNAVVGFDPETGRALWEHEWSEGYDEHAAWPVYGEPWLLTCSPFRLGSRLLRLEGGADGASARLVWKSGEMSNDIASSIVVRGHIYGFDLHELQASETHSAAGEFKCIRLTTGEVCWSTGRTGHATVIAADGKLILLNETGELILARESPVGYEELGRARLFRGETCWTQPTLFRGRLYVRSPSQAACVWLGSAEPPGPRGAGASVLSATQDRSRHGWFESIWKSDSLYAPDLPDMLRWYGVCMLGVFAASGLLTLLAHEVVRRKSPLHALGTSRVVLCSAAFLAGAGGTVLASHVTGEFVFTWPAALFVSYQLALCSAARTETGDRKARLVSLAAGLGFVVLCLAYWYLCRSLFIVMGLGFLAGFPLASPAAVLAAKRISATSRVPGDLFWSASSFSVYFWLSALFTLWRIRA